MSTLRTLTVAGATAAGLLAAVAPVSAAPTPKPISTPTAVAVYAGPASTRQTVVLDPTADSKAAPTAKFVVTYVGFSTTAKAAFQRAVNTWAKTLTTSVPITVKATWEPLGTGILGSAGPSYGWNCSGLMCIDAIANKKAGKNLDPSPDIVARFSSNFSNWWFGTGPAPKGKYDFQSVVTHELGHGVGFLGLGSITGGLGSVQLSGLNTAYDRATRLGPTSTSALLWKMPNNSTTLAKALTSNNVYFDSAKVRAANGAKSAKLYAPSIWRQGSSYSHLDEAIFPAGNKNSLMTYAIGDGETIRTPGPVAVAILKSIGW